MSKLLLGKDSGYPTIHDPSILEGMSRLDSRKRIGIDENSSRLYGIDSWTCYELSWLNKNGVPNNGILYFSYDCHSKLFIESKSLKMYLFSLNNEIFESKEKIESTIKSDLESALKTELSVEILDKPREIITQENSIDSLDIERPSPKPNSLILTSTDKEVDEDISCSLFRSLCPVTAQPDWATIFISYKGKEIDHKNLLSYLLSYRNHQGFHEECLEKIFFDLKRRCLLDSLLVRANYLRRGGIEINPVRTDHKNYEQILRDQRQ